MGDISCGSGAKKLAAHGKDAANRANMITKEISRRRKRANLYKLLEDLRRIEEERRCTPTT